jgi:hypothetical protein
MLPLLLPCHYAIFDYFSFMPLISPLFARWRHFSLMPLLIDYAATPLFSPLADDYYAADISPLLMLPTLLPLSRHYALRCYRLFVV